PVTQPTHPKTFGEAVTEVKDAIVEEGEKLAQASTGPTPMFDTVTGTSLSLSLVNRLFPGAAAAAAANDRDKKPKVPQTPEERRQMQEAIDKIPPEALKYFNDLIPDDMKPTAPTVMAVPDNEIIKRGIIR